MRVIAGRYKGRRLTSPSWPGLRPTSDRLKETLFAILSPHLDGARVLDGFAGSGALGVEALSRGAGEVLFVDSDPRSVGLIGENLRHCGIAGGYAMIRGTLAGVLGELPAHRRFDLVLLDPPYDESDLDGVLRAAAARLEAGGLLVLEHAARRRVPDGAGVLTRVRQVRAGASALSFYRRAEAPSSGATEET